MSEKAIQSALGGIGRKPTVWEILTSERYFKWTLLIPLIIVLAVFMLYPLFYCLYYSFHQYGMQGNPIFVGADNYRQLLRDKSFLEALGRTAKVLVICVVSELLIGLGLGMLWSREFPGERVVRGLALLPLLVAPLILSLLWNFMFEYDFGAVNMLLSALGLNKVYWWAPERALYTICFITIWQWFPFSTFVLVAGLRSLPKDVFEAARVDGASNWYVFRRLTLPMLSPLIMIIVVLRTMWLIRLFDPLYGTTRGGVGTELLDWIVYRTAFVYFDIGYGSTMAIFSLLLTIALCAVMFKFLIRALGGNR
ncbi:sugar ABC transporter permease [Thermatribacter velox]|uniref:Sugar ABC transporter permease n=1 Tax=Thermatribacter velox TaxID=3039681 RepID=A0ABZ2YD45_9BACT